MRAWLLLLAVLATFQTIVQVASTEDISTKFIAAITTATNNSNKQLQKQNFNYNLIDNNYNNNNQIKQEQTFTASTINNSNKTPVQHKKHNTFNHNHHQHHHHSQKKHHKKDIAATHFYENSLSDNLSEKQYNHNNYNNNNIINNNSDIIIEIKNFEEFETKPNHQHPKKVQQQQHLKEDLNSSNSENNNNNYNINNSEIITNTDQLENFKTTNTNIVNNNLSENNFNEMAVKASESKEQKNTQTIISPSMLTKTFNNEPLTVSSTISSTSSSSTTFSSIASSTSPMSVKSSKSSSSSASTLQTAAKAKKASSSPSLPFSPTSPSDEDFKQHTDYESDYHPDSLTTSDSISSTISSSSSTLISSATSDHDNNNDDVNTNDNHSIKSNIDDDELTYSNKELLLEKVKPDPTTLVEIENSLLSLFNMKRPPTIDRSKIIIPDAMKALYAQMMGQRIDSVNIPKPGLLTKSANTVRSFTHKDSKIDDRFPHHHRFRLHFDIKTIPGEEKLKAAELQLSRDAISHAVLNPRLANRTRYQVLVYDITRVGIRGKREPSYLLLDNKTIRLNSTDTISLDVQPAVDRWLASPTKNYGLLVEVRTMRSLKPAPHHHVRLRRSADETHNNWLRKQPLLFTYTDDGRHKSRSIRDVSNRAKRAGHNRRNHRRKNTEETCHRKALYVDFSDVGWANWIVAPPGYDAFYCHGKCPFPLAEHFNSTNHAVVQTLVNNINPEKVPKPCCVPTQLEGISMLYLNDQNSVVLKNYQDMTVVGCGCR